MSFYTSIIYSKPEGSQWGAIQSVTTHNNIVFAAYGNNQVIITIDGNNTAITNVLDYDIR